MKLNRTGQITARDNHRPWFIRQAGSHTRELCAECSERSQMITLEEAALAANVDVPAIYRLIEAGQLHFVKTDEALLLVCLGSLIKSRSLQFDKIGERK